MSSNSAATDNSAAFGGWLASLSERYGIDPGAIAKASSDAGFRQYFRVKGRDRSYIVMEASGETQESFEAFIKIDALMRNEAKLNAPEIFEADHEHRFMLLSDLGTKTYLDVLSEDNARDLMDKATTALVAWQKISRPGVLPEYSREVLSRELSLFPEWYVGRHRGVTWDETHRKWWKMAADAILENNCREARVFVHRDFMPRNLMISDPTPGILDFQDALYGPVSYDIASLMRDAFISWGEEFVLDTTIRYWEKARKAGIPVPGDFSAFYRDVEFMGVQRHLKVLGIFARLNYRDGKPRYLADTPRFIDYVRKTSQRYIVLSPLLHLVNELEGVAPKTGYTF
jgi:aminoglycoside/choline kinase family phosphotransferase